ncbi:MAG: 3'-5' exonuclease [Lachnospiraceae bacterium]|nr:3'-5' exonuclease [Lachnospiraceae bacterium]
MNYIVLDLEWNQCPYGKAREDEKLPFEIIEIGAVKLNERKEIVDTYHRLVKPVIYRKIHFRTKEVIAVTMEELQRDGILFPDAAEEFLAWCGSGYRFCTWGTTDLTELQRNLAYYYMEEILPGPILYEDVQKLFALAYETRKDRRSLEYAVDFLQIEEDGEFHQALDDAVYTARVLGSISDEIIHENYSIDCFQNPKSRKEEIRIRYGTYEKFISREFATKELLMEDREVTAVRCFSCLRNARRKIGWFSDNGRNYFAVGCCQDHGYVKCKVRIRKAADGKFFAIKTTKLIGEAELEKIKDKQASIRGRRQKKGK